MDAKVCWRKYLDTFIKINIDLMKKHEDTEVRVIF